MIEASARYGMKLFKELFVMGTTSVLEEIVLKERISGSKSKDLSLVNRLQEVKRINQYLDSVLGQIQQAIDEGTGILEVCGILLSAIEEVKHFRDLYPVNPKELVKHYMSLIPYNQIPYNQ